MLLLNRCLQPYSALTMDSVLVVCTRRVVERRAISVPHLSPTLFYDWRQFRFLFEGPRRNLVGIHAALIHAGLRGEHHHFIVYDPR